MAQTAPSVAAALPWIADALILIGVLVMTIGVYGVVRMPSTYTRLHAASKAVVLGAMPLLLAAAVTGGKETILRVVLIGVFLLLTTPVSSHMIGRAAYMRGEKMHGSNAVDESGSGLAGPEAEPERDR
ncbi:MAG: monovalent cation/H(+) antiporter subunit G [Actinomycetota bacterium]|nr:monovalent cation/H(+) antiporter subunit G [Actinomycetota bacterium]